MTRTRRILTGTAFAGILLALTSAASASPIWISLEQLNIVASPGQTITFRGVIYNAVSDPEDIAYLNGSTNTLNGAFTLDPAITLTPDDGTVFLTNAPWTVEADETTFLFDMFSVTIPLVDSYIPGPYTGTFQVLGGFLPDETEEPEGFYPLEVIGSVDYTVTVVPEPGSAALAAAGFAAAALWARRRRLRARRE